MRFFWSHILLLGTGLVLTGQTAMPKDPIPLALESAILFALNKNPDVLIALEKSKQASFGVDEARSSYYPQVDVTVKGGREYNDPTAASVHDKLGQSSNSSETRVFVNQLLFDGFATDEEVERRKQLVGSADLQTTLAVEKILTDTIESFTDVWRAQRSVTESRRFVDVVTKITDKVRLMNEAGAESKTKREYVDSRLAAAKSELNNAEASLAKATSDLESITGVLPPFSAQRPPQFDPTQRQMDSYFALARQENSGIKLNQSDRKALEHQQESQAGSYYPTLSLQLEGKQSYDIGGNVGRVRAGTAMLVMNYKLFDGFARDAAAGRIESQITENDLRRDKLVRDTQKNLRQAYNQLVATKRDLAANIKEVISSENLQALYKQQFELGEGDVITIIEGEERLHNANMKGLRLEADMVVNSFALLRQIGALRKGQFCERC